MAAPAPNTGATREEKKCDNCGVLTLDYEDHPSSIMWFCEKCVPEPDIVGLCEKCDLEIERGSDEHDKCFIGADDKFYCQNCPWPSSE